MCCCGQPTINGQPGYRWQPDDKPSKRPVDPPALQDDETLLYDEPGRCGGLDAHCSHFRVIRSRTGTWLLSRRGADDARIRLFETFPVVALANLDTHARFWILFALDYANRDGAREAAKQVTSLWTKAAAEKRIKTRKQPSRGTVKVWIEPAVAIATV